MKPSFNLKIPEFLNKVKSAIKISKGTLTSDSSGIFGGTTAETVFEELETQLLLADVGVETTMWLLNEVRQDALASREEGLDIAILLKGKVRELLETIEKPFVIDQAHKPHVILVVGVNGSGKTTTIGKLTSNISEHGYSCLLYTSPSPRD